MTDENNTNAIILFICMVYVMLSFQMKVTMNAINHKDKDRDFTMKTKLSGIVSFTYSDKQDPKKQPTILWAYIGDIWDEDKKEREVTVTTGGTVELNYYIKQQIKVTIAEEEDEPLDHTKLWAEVSSSIKGAQSDTAENLASSHGRTQGSDRQGLNEEVRAASGSVHQGAQQHDNPMFESQDNME